MVETNILWRFWGARKGSITEGWVTWSMVFTFMVDIRQIHMTYCSFLILVGPKDDYTVAPWIKAWCSGWLIQVPDYKNNRFFYLLLSILFLPSTGILTSIFNQLIVFQRALFPTYLQWPPQKNLRRIFIATLVQSAVW